MVRVLWTVVVGLAAVGAAAAARRLLGAGSRVLSLPGASSTGLMPDEQLSRRVQEQLEAHGLWTEHLDVNTVDGVVYVRGRDESQARVDAITRMAHSVPGVAEVVNEMKPPE